MYNPNVRSNNFNMPNGAEQVSWDELSEDDQDFFKNPHVHPTTRNDYTVPGFSDAEKAMEIITRLNTQGVKRALDELNRATEQLDRYERQYPKNMVDNMRTALSARLTSASDTE
jgi:hypothetical protein